MAGKQCTHCHGSFQSPPEVKIQKLTRLQHFKCVWPLAHAPATACMQRSEDSFPESFLSSSHVSPQDQTLVIKVGSKSLPLLMHLANPRTMTLRRCFVFMCEYIAYMDLRVQCACSVPEGQTRAWNPLELELYRERVVSYRMDAGNYTRVLCKWA